MSDTEDLGPEPPEEDVDPEEGPTIPTRAMLLEVDEESYAFPDAPESGSSEGPDIESEAQSEGGTAASFDERWRDDFEGLLFLGALTKSFRWRGHSFVIRTLTVDELIEVGSIIKEWTGTLGETKAYQAAIVGASIVEVDGRSMPEGLGSEQTDLSQRFRYVRKHWYPVVIDVLYTQYLILEQRVEQILSDLGN